MQVYDPRLKALVESDNPALIARTVNYGVLPLADEEEAYWIDLANYCEEEIMAEEAA
jgi:hypothetical protein